MPNLRSAAAELVLYFSFFKHLDFLLQDDKYQILGVLRMNSNSFCPASTSIHHVVVECVCLRSHDVGTGIALGTSEHPLPKVN